MTSATRFSACAGKASSINNAARANFSELGVFMEMPAPEAKSFCDSRPGRFAGSTRQPPAMPPSLNHRLGEIEGEFPYFERATNRKQRAGKSGQYRPRRI